MARPVASLVSLLVAELLVQPSRSFRFDSGAGAGLAGRPAVATCPGSGFFVDWGSSGMKALPVHAAQLGEPNVTAEDSIAGFKIKGLKPQSSRAELLEALEELRQLLPAQQGAGRAGAAGARFAVLATAGHRLDPERAEQAWSVIKEWSSQNPGILGRCSEADDEDCQTIPGSQEAAWELAAALEEAGDVGSNFAFASAGGASVQMGFRGSQSDMNQCLEDLSGLDSKYDKRRAAIKVVGGNETLMLSFLSIAGLEEEKRACRDFEENDMLHRACDYRAGGLDQVRASFSNWLRTTMHKEVNPCLSEYTKLRKHKGRLCQDLFGTDECVLDKYGGGISGLPPSTHPLISQAAGRGAYRARACQNLIREFLNLDLMLSLWYKSDACWSLGQQADRVLLMTSFARPTQFGVPTPDWVRKKNAMKQAFNLDWVDAAQAEEGEEGLIMTSVMLHTFLDLVGIRWGALLKGFGGSWTEQAMKERSLKSGWAEAGGTCPGK